MKANRGPLPPSLVAAIAAALMLGVLLAVHLAQDTWPILAQPWRTLAVGAWLIAALAAGLVLWWFVRRQRTAQGQVQATDALIQDALDNVPDGLLVVDAGGLVIRANVPMLEIARVSPVLMLGRPLAELILRDERGEALSWPRYGLLRARIGATGSERDVEVFVKPLAGSPAFLLVHIRDITRELGERRLIENQQRELEVLADLARILNRVTDEESLVREAIDHVAREIPVAHSGGAFLIDRKRGVLRLVGTFGLDPAFIAAEQQILLGECLCGQAAVTGEVLYSESSHQDPCHSRHRAAAPHGHIILPLRTASEVVGVVFLYLREGIQLDQSHHRLLDGIASEVGLALMRVRDYRALQTSQGELERLFEEAPDAMVLADSVGAVVRANRLARRVFAPGESLPGRLPWAGVMAMSRGGDRPPRVTLTDHDGQEMVVEITANAMSDAAVQLILRDVTWQAKLEKHAMEVQKMEAVGVLAAGLAHDLNNILGALLAHQERLSGAIARGDGPVMGTSLDSMRSGIAEVSSMIERLLAFARPVAPRLDVVEIGRLVRGNVELLRPLVDKRIRLVVAIQDGLIARVDASIVSHALMNLGLNALAAMPGGGELTVAVYAVGEGEACLEVRDTGMGIAQADLPRIFEPFFTTKPHGSGLGLATVRAGVASLGGRVEVNSRPGEGSAFKIMLPRCAAPAQEASLATPARRRLVLAEDAAVLRRFTARQLEERGWEVVEASSVAELRETVHASTPEFALVDWRLGDEVAAEVVAELQSEGLRVVVLSGDPAAVRVPGVPVLGKPIDWERIEEYLAHV